MNKAARSILLLSLFIQSAHAQAPLRLIAQTYYKLNSAGGGSYDQYDSMRFAYRGWNGSRYDFNSLEYTPVENYYSDAVFFTGDPSKELVASNNIDSSFILNIDYDTSERHQYGLKEYDSYRTHSSGTGPSVFESYKRGSSPAYNAMNLYSSGRLTKAIITFRHPATQNIDTGIIRTLSYDGSGRLILDSCTQKLGTIWSEMLSRRYTYGAGKGYLTMEYRSGPTMARPYPRTEKRVTNTYYPSGQLQRSATEALTSALSPRFYLYNIDSFGYTPGINGHTWHTVRNFDTFGNETYRQYTVNLRTNASGLKDSGVTIDPSNPAYPISAYAITYDATGNPMRRNHYRFFNPTGFLNGYELYYYEPVAATGVGQPMSGEHRFSVHPNPSQGALTITSPTYPAGSACTISIQNSLGQLVYRESLHWSGPRHQIVLSSEIAAGQYYLQLQDAGGHMLDNKLLIIE